MTLSDLLIRRDGSPKYMSLRWTPHGAMIVVHIPRLGIDTGLRIKRHGFHQAYHDAVAIVSKHLVLPKQTAAAQETLLLAREDFMKRYNVELVAETRYLLVKKD